MLVGLDIGTSKIVAIVAEVLEEGRLNIIGMGQVPSRGLKRGMVVNIESTVQASLARCALLLQAILKQAFEGRLVLAPPKPNVPADHAITEPIMG